MASSVEYNANPFIISIRAGAADDSGEWDPPAPCRVLDAWLLMTQAGTALDTAKLTDGTNDITDDVDLSALLDTALASLDEVDDDNRDLIPGTDILTSVLAGGAKCDIFVLLAWT